MDACTAACGGLAAGAIFFIVMVVLVFVMVTAIIKAVIYCMIFQKAGYHWALGLLTLVPIACIVMPFILALSDWPIQKELRLLKQKIGTSA
jgi:hypothetical protein